MEPDVCVKLANAYREGGIRLMEATFNHVGRPEDTNPAIIRKVNAAGLVTLPGAMTPTEIELAHETEADCVKVFPARALGSGAILLK